MTHRREENQQQGGGNQKRLNHIHPCSFLHRRSYRKSIRAGIRQTRAHSNARGPSNTCNYALACAHTRFFALSLSCAYGHTHAISRTLTRARCHACAVSRTLSRACDLKHAVSRTLSHASRFAHAIPCAHFRFCARCAVHAFDSREHADAVVIGFRFAFFILCS